MWSFRFQTLAIKVGDYNRAIATVEEVSYFLKMSRRTKKIKGYKRLETLGQYAHRPKGATSKLSSDHARRLKSQCYFVKTFTEAVRDTWSSNFPGTWSIFQQWYQMDRSPSTSFPTPSTSIPSSSLFTVLDAAISIVIRKWSSHG